MPVDPTGIIGQGVGVGMGLMLEKHNDKRQLKQQDRLNNLQFVYDKKMTDYSYEKQLQMWKDTNYAAQKEELEKAGLNPGLLYGMSGGGGVTTGSGGESTKGEGAPKGGGEALAGSGMGMQLGMMQAQIELAKSQANKNNVEAQKIGGVDTKEAETRIKSLTAGVTNTEALTALTKVETTLKELDTIFAGKSIEDRLDQVEYTARRARTELENAQTNTYINKATRDEQIRIVQLSAIEGALRNGLITAQTTNTQQATEESKAKVKQMAENIQQEWAKIAINVGEKTHNSVQELIQIETNKQLIEDGNKLNPKK